MFWENESRRPTPTKALKKIVYQRDKGKCRVCGADVDPFNFEIGHNIAHSKGGKLTLKNAILLCSSCNKSMRTLTLKEVRATLGLPKSPEEETKTTLQKLSLRELKYLAKNHRIKLKSRTVEDLFTTTKVAPTKRQYVNALAKELTEKQVNEEIKNMPKPERKKKRKGRNDSFW
jgi:hypothetical protein